MATYNNIPVDAETKDMVLKLCEIYGMSRRSQGAMVKKLAKEKLELLNADVENVESIKGRKKTKSEQGDKSA